MSQIEMFATTTVHCFFGWCRHVVRATSAQSAHDAMEEHYRVEHQAEILRIAPR